MRLRQRLWRVVFFFILRRLSQVDGVDASSTLVVVVSKSFTTAETIMNAKTVKDWLTASIKANATDVVRQHVRPARLLQVGAFNRRPQLGG